MVLNPWRLPAHSAGMLRGPIGSYKEVKRNKQGHMVLSVNSVSSAEGDPIQPDCRILKVIQVLKEDPSRTLLELATSCRMSMSRLSHLFKREVGTNVKNYRMDCRLQVAAALLLSPGASIKEIAYMAGYQHTSSFVRAFKSRFGFSPASYRRKHWAKLDSSFG
ncbi:MAG: AraC family transcriptional regulator [Candidatus Sulfotelmatobacter sp.]|jgi:AraC-like DNA-binding protein